ncbi:MAG: hypothetical protein AB8C84_01130 [Oligoflexales bacterium]
MKFYVPFFSLFFLACGQNQRRPNNPEVPIDKTIEISQLDEDISKDQSFDATVSQQNFASAGDFQVNQDFLLAAGDEISDQEDIEVNTESGVFISHVNDSDSDPEEQLPLLIKSYLEKNKIFESFVGKRNKSSFAKSIHQDHVHGCLDETFECSLEGNCQENLILDICTNPVEVIHLQMSFQHEKESEICFIMDGLISGDEIIYMHLPSTRINIECLPKIELN